MKERRNRSNAEGSSDLSAAATIGTLLRGVASDPTRLVQSETPPPSAPSSPSGMAERVELIRRLFVLFPAGVTVERIEGYAELLGEFCPEDVATACEATAQIWTSTFPPPPGVLIDRAREARRVRVERDRRRKGGQAPAAGEASLWSQTWTRLRRETGRFPSDEEVEEALRAR